MLRRSFVRMGPGPRWSYKVHRVKFDTPRKWIPFEKKHYWLEEFSNDFNQVKYLHPREMQMWYASTEIRHAKAMLRDAQIEQSDSHNAGRHVSGYSAFERELERKGIPVDKYPLPSTTAVRRLHEMVLLRRRKLEEKSSEAMKEKRNIVACSFPSEWYDETNGPLNVHFLHFAQKAFSEPITELPRTPIKHAEVAHK